MQDIIYTRQSTDYNLHPNPAESKRQVSPKQVNELLPRQHNLIYFNILRELFQIPCGVNYE